MADVPTSTDQGIELISCTTIEEDGTTPGGVEDKGNGDESPEPAQNLKPEETDDIPATQPSETLTAVRSITEAETPSETLSDTDTGSDNSTGDGTPPDSPAHGKRKKGNPSDKEGVSEGKATVPIEILTDENNDTNENAPKPTEELIEEPSHSPTETVDEDETVCDKPSPSDDERPTSAQTVIEVDAIVAQPLQNGTPPDSLTTTEDAPQGQRTAPEGSPDPTGKHTQHTPTGSAASTEVMVEVGEKNPYSKVTEERSPGDDKQSFLTRITNMYMYTSHRRRCLIGMTILVILLGVILIAAIASSEYTYLYIHTLYI